MASSRTGGAARRGAAAGSGGAAGRWAARRGAAAGVAVAAALALAGAPPAAADGPPPPESAPSPSTTTPPPPLPPQPPPPPVAPPPPLATPPMDLLAPRLVLGGRRRQPLGPVLSAFATCSERCELDASARVQGAPGVGSLPVVTPAKAGEGGTRTRFEVRISPHAERLMLRAIRAGQEVRVVVSVYALDLAENETAATLRIRVREPRAPAPRRPHAPALTRS